MAERSYPFDSGPGATINEDQWSYLAGSWQDDGVQSPGPWDTALKLTSSSEVLLLHIAIGHANISGIHYHLDAPRTIAFAANASGNPRLDRIVLKLDRSTNTISFLYKQGTPSSSPIAPSIDRTWNSPEINIGTFIVRAGSSIVLPAECFDQRDYIGRYIKVTEDVPSSQEGTIAYQPSVGKFFAKGASTIEIGAQPNLTPYLLAATASSTYSPIHSHPYAASSHTHSVPSHSHYPASQTSFTATAGPNYTVEGFNSGSYSSETATLVLKLRRTSSSAASAGESIATVPSIVTPAGYAGFPCYVHSANLSSVTKAGFAHLFSTTIVAVDTYVGFDERIWLAATWRLSNGRLSGGPV